MTKNKKLPDYVGAFAELAKNFVLYKQSLGLKYESEMKNMSRFTKFADKLGATEPVLTKDLVLAWIEKRPNETDKTREHRHSVICRFAEYLMLHGHTPYVAPKINYKGSRHFTPHIFTHDEIERIFISSDDIAPSNISPYVHKILPVLLRMLYSCGLRISEALRLTDADVDLEQGILTIKHAKFDQDRLIPMSKSLIAACKTYRESMTLLPGDYFFPARDRSQISPLTIYNRFKDILWKSGIPYQGKPNGPRLHDMRHTFAVHALQQWTKDGNDIYCMLPMLSVYLGHEYTSSTGRYLRLTAEVYPEIVEITSKNCGFVIPTIKKTSEVQGR